MKSITSKLPGTPYLLKMGLSERSPWKRRHQKSKVASSCTQETRYSEILALLDELEPNLEEEEVLG